MMSNLLDSWREINPADGVIALILIWGAVQGYRSGFLRTLINLIASWVGWGCGVFYNKQIVTLLEERFGVLTYLSDIFAQGFSSLVQPPDGGWEASASLLEQLQHLHLPPAVEQFLASRLTESSALTPAAPLLNLSALGSMLASLLLAAAVFVAIIFVCRVIAALLCWLLRDVLKVARSRPDALLGLCLGVIMKGLFLAVGLALLTPLLAGWNNQMVAIPLRSSFLANSLLTFFYFVAGGSIDFTYITRMMGRL